MGAMDNVQHQTELKGRVLVRDGRTAGEWRDAGGWEAYWEAYVAHNPAGLAE